MADFVPPPPTPLERPSERAERHRSMGHYRTPSYPPEPPPPPKPPSFPWDDPLRHAANILNVLGCAILIAGLLTGTACTGSVIALEFHLAAFGLLMHRAVLRAT